MWQTSCSCEKCHRISAAHKKQIALRHNGWIVLCLHCQKMANAFFFRWVIYVGAACFRMVLFSFVTPSFWMQMSVWSFLKDVGRLAVVSQPLVEKLLPHARALSPIPFWIMGLRRCFRVVFTPNPGPPFSPCLCSLGVLAQWAYLYILLSNYVIFDRGHNVCFLIHTLWGLGFCLLLDSLKVKPCVVTDLGAIAMKRV